MANVHTDTMRKMRHDGDVIKRTYTVTEEADLAAVYIAKARGHGNRSMAVSEALVKLAKSIRRRLSTR